MLDIYHVYVSYENCNYFNVLVTHIHLTLRICHIIYNKLRQTHTIA